MFPCRSDSNLFLRIWKETLSKYFVIPFSSKHEMLMEIIRNYLTMKGQLLKRCVLISARFVSHVGGSWGGLFFIIWHLVSRSLATASCRLGLRAAIIVLECSDCYTDVVLHSHQSIFQETHNDVIFPHSKYVSHTDNNELWLFLFVFFLHWPKSTHLSKCWDSINMMRNNTRVYPL